MTQARKTKNQASHIILRYKGYICLNCGKYEEPQLPAKVSVFTNSMKSFIKAHKKCPKTWTEPVLIYDPNLSIETRMYKWLGNGKIGISSKSIASFMSGVELLPRWEPPRDPGDFSKCYELLNYIPEWRERIPEMKSVSPVWSRLIDNWSVLEKMFVEKNENMFQFMQDLREN